MAFGIGRSMARRAGRTVAAIVAIVVVGEGSLVPALRIDGAPAAVADVVRVAPASDRLTHPAGPPITVAAPGIDLAVMTPTEPEAAPVDDAAAGLQPSIQYEEAERHAGDRISFTPGGRVSEAFRPRPGDAWPVDGRPPVRLPEGRLDGKAIRGQGQLTPERPPLRGRGGAATDDAAPDSTVDQPTRTGTPIAATTVAFQAAAPVTPGAGDPPVDPSAAVSVNGLRREIFGFLPYWKLNSSLRLDYRKISTIAYFGVGVDGLGRLQKRNADGSTTVGWSGWTSAKLSSIIATAHRNHTRVVLTVQSFAWNTSGAARQRQLLGSPSHRLTLARQIAAAVRDRGADGVNLDFEPLASTYDAEFTALVRTIRAELNKVHRGYQITFDTTGSIGNYPIAAATAPGGADAIFVMGYDYRTGGSSPVGSVAPLHKNGYDIADTIAAYTARVSPSKIILGVPYYGRAWSTSSSRLHGTNMSSTKTGASTAVVYDQAADYLAQYGHRYDTGEQVAWTAYKRENCTGTYGCVTSWRQLYVDDARSIAAKYDLVNAYRLRGAGIWALGYDGARPELWAAIQRKFVSDTTAPRAGIRTLPGRVLNPGFKVTWTGTDDVGVAGYDVQVSIDGGAWRGWIVGTKATSATWYGHDRHGYAFRVRARDPRGNVSAWNVTSTSSGGGALVTGGFGLVRVDGLSKRSAPDTSAPKLGTFASGEILAIVGGPRSADGYTWFQVRGPLSEWGPVRVLSSAVWVAAVGSGRANLTPVKAPNATRVAAAISDLGVGGAGAASIGTSAAAVAHRSFSPNGDGSGDRIAVDWTNDRTLDRLAARVFRADGVLVGSIPLAATSKGHHRWIWNGAVAGRRLPDGRYLATLVGSAGGTTFFNPTASFIKPAFDAYRLTVDTIGPKLTSASISSTLLSPNGDGIRESLVARIAATGADRWSFTVAPLAGQKVGAVVASRSGTGASGAVKWTGRTNTGAVVPDGVYRVMLAASDIAGNQVRRSWNVRVDRTPARITPLATPALFSPNGDGAADAAKLSWSASEPITGTARIYHGATLVRSWSITNAAAGAVTWNGRNAAGTLVGDGAYAFRVSGRDAAGNAAVRATRVVVDRTLSTVRWSASGFFPQDGDAIAAASRATFKLSRSAVVSVGIYQGTKLVRTVWTRRSLAVGTWGWVWNGKTNTGAYAPRGRYEVRVTATSKLGTAVIGRTVLADAFGTTLSASTIKAGQTLTVTFTATEALRALPSVSFVQPGRAAVVRTATSLGSGRYRATFRLASGPVGTATVKISGRDSAGGLNVSTATLRVR